MIGENNMAKTNSSVPAFGMRDKLGYMFECSSK